MTTKPRAQKGRATKKGRVPKMLRGCDSTGFGHAQKWDNMGGYYLRRRKTKAEVLATKTNIQGTSSVMVDQGAGGILLVPPTANIQPSTPRAEAISFHAQITTVPRAPINMNDSGALPSGPTPRVELRNLRAQLPTGPRTPINMNTSNFLPPGATPRTEARSLRAQIPVGPQAPINMNYFNTLPLGPATSSLFGSQIIWDSGSIAPSIDDFSTASVYEDGQNATPQCNHVTLDTFSVCGLDDLARRADAETPFAAVPNGMAFGVTQLAHFQESYPDFPPFSF